MNTSVQVDNFLQYLVDKYFVFDPKAELDESNTIDDISILKRSLDNVFKIKKVSDENMVELCKRVFQYFRCYNIGLLVNGSFGDQLCDIDACKIYMHYKNYKCSSSTQTRERETSLILDNTLNTNDTYYVDSLETITTRDLIDKFGDYIKSGKPDDNFRYEYRFRFAKDSRVYKFSLYDYKNDDGEFYKDDDIYWHIASNTDKRDVTKSFVKYLYEYIFNDTNDTNNTNNTHDTECC